MIDAERDDKQFRRGVVLGLTMAEILLLLIFLLMLLMVAKLQEEQAFARDNKESNEADRKLAGELHVIIEDLRQRSGPGTAEAEFDITKEYRTLAEQKDAATAKVEQWQPIIEKVEQAGKEKGVDILSDYARMKADLEAAKPALPLLEAAKKAAAPDATVEEAIQQMAEAARIGREFMKNAQEVEPGAGDEEGVEHCTRELKSCEQQTVHLNNRLNAQTGGRDKKPCWVDVNGKIQYIFDTRLRPEGIVVVDNQIPERVQDQADLPIFATGLGSPLNRAAFSAAFTPLLEWSEAKDCRFYVRLIDETGSGDKGSYKDMRRTVEGWFYILDMK